MILIFSTNRTILALPHEADAPSPRQGAAVASPATTWHRTKNQPTMGPPSLRCPKTAPAHCISKPRQDCHGGEEEMAVAPRKMAPCRCVRGVGVLVHTFGVAAFHITHRRGGRVHFIGCVESMDAGGFTVTSWSNVDD